jgi:HPt (histidine-containing phosphotransfer) domain-containing protein
MMQRLAAINAELSAARDEAAQAHHRAKLVLDSVDQGLLLVGRDGVPIGEGSAAAVALLDSGADGAALWEMVGHDQPDVAAFLELGWEVAFEGVLPIDVALSQLPRSCAVAGRHLTMKYSPVSEPDGSTSAVLVMITDTTEQLERQQSERRLRQQIDVLRAMADGDVDINVAMAELRTLVEAAADADNPSLERRRALHTLKGNAATVGLSELAERCHQLEGELGPDSGGQLHRDLSRRLLEAWAEAVDLLEPVTGPGTSDDVRIPGPTFVSMVEEVRRLDERLGAKLESLGWEATERRLRRLGRQAADIGRRRHGIDLDITIDDDGSRFPWDRVPDLWPATVHLIRNAIDHGIEPPDERLALGKPEVGSLILRSRRQGPVVCIELVDDGRGIDWAKVAAKAATLGLANETKHDLVEALFTDGFSTADTATELSGRGVGMAAIRQACIGSGGSIDIDSRPGAGTVVRLRVPYPPVTNRSMVGSGTTLSR